MLAEEHLVFKFSSIDPGEKCSEIVASVNVAKVTSSIITAIMISLRDLIPMVGSEIGMATSDAAGCNWVLFQDTLSTHIFQDALPCEILASSLIITLSISFSSTSPLVARRNSSSSLQG